MIVLVFNYLYLKETKPDNVQASRFQLRDFAAILKNRTGSSIIYLGFIQYYVFYDFLVFLPNILSDRYGLSGRTKGTGISADVAWHRGRQLRTAGKSKHGSRVKRLVVLTTYLNAISVLFFLIFYSISLPLAAGWDYLLRVISSGSRSRYRQRC